MKRFIRADARAGGGGEGKHFLWGKKKPSGGTFGGLARVRLRARVTRKRKRGFPPAPRGAGGAGRASRARAPPPSPRSRPSGRPRRGSRPPRPPGPPSTRGGRRREVGARRFVQSDTSRLPRWRALPVVPVSVVSPRPREHELVALRAALEVLTQAPTHGLVPAVPEPVDVRAVQRPQERDERAREDERREGPARAPRPAMVRRALRRRPLRGARGEAVTAVLVPIARRPGSAAARPGAALHRDAWSERHERRREGRGFARICSYLV
jgi:hypothetical protein